MRGIAILGLNGSGKSTLAHALAQATGFFEMDAEDYYFPEQRASRRLALEGNAENAVASDEKPFSKPRSQTEAQAEMLADIKAHPSFVLSCVSANWNAEILGHIDGVFWIQVPLEERLKRIRAREERRFGNRVLPGGDLYESQSAFHAMVEKRDPGIVEESIKRLSCPVYELDGLQPVSENLQKILQILNQ